MKRCKYCGQIAGYSSTVCSSCGASEFSNICDNCGNEFENGMHCPRCGVKVGQKEKTCPRCGNRYFTNACPDCGFVPMESFCAPQQEYAAPYGAQRNTPVQNYGNPKQKSVALLLCIFLGVFGAHKFYEGKVGMGLLYLFTYGLFFIGWICDIFIIAGKSSTYY